MIITRAPRVFPVLWTLIAPFIDENTRKKIHIHAGDRAPSQETMLHYLPVAHIPDFLGGTSECRTPDAGHIPKSDYLPQDEDGAVQGAAGLMNLSRTAYAYKGLPYEASWTDGRPVG